MTNRTLTKNRIRKKSVKTPTHLPKTVACFLLALSLLLSACGHGSPKPLATGEVTEENVDQVVAVLEQAGLANTDVFKSWVLAMDEQNEGDEQDTGTGFSDADCRMTVMLLAGDLIRAGHPETTYNGDYLMFDLDLIENDDRFQLLREKEALFTTLFGEMPISKAGFEQTLSEQWARHDIHMESDRCAIISILFKAYDQEAAFVGHTGILVDCRDMDNVQANYLFVEKLAFGDPFTITLMEDEAELLTILSEREDYTSTEEDPDPAVYKNGELLNSLS